MARRLAVLGACICLALVAPPTALAGHGDRPTIGSTLDLMLERGRIDEGRYEAYSELYAHVRSALRRLDGAPKAALDGVLDQLRYLARERRLDGRLVPAFNVLAVNYGWFWEKRNGVPAASRATFNDSEVVYQHYHGVGWQIQPLASYARLNALLTGKEQSVERARRLADDLLELAVTRSGGLANEYYFPWSGGEAGWVSGMATGTAIQALARLWKATGDGRYRDAAREMLENFEREPPAGVRLPEEDEGVHYLIYSQDPDLLVGNAFAQALIGLHDYVEITGDPRGAELLEAGMAQARQHIDRYDTGSWSLYYRRPGTDDGEESNLHYHRLFGTFLGRLCDRTGEGAFCRLEARFERYEKAPIRIGRLRTRTGDERQEVRVWVSKRGSGVLTLSHEGEVIRSHRLSLERGTQVVRWRRPEDGGDYRLTMRATSLTGIDSRRDREFELEPRDRG